MTSRAHVKRRSESRFHRRTKPGASPGAFVVDPKAPHPHVSVFAYGPEEIVHEYHAVVSRLPALLEKFPVTWVNVDGLGDAETIKKLGEIFGLHRLALEDVVNVHQRPKAEAYDAHLFLVTRMIAEIEPLVTEQISIFLGKKFVVTFQERPGDCLEPVRERLRKVDGRIRKAGPDYLAYSILDTTLDAYFPVLEQYGVRLDSLEDEVALRPRGTTLARIHDVSADLRHLRRVTWPHRDTMSSLAREDNPFFASETRVYLRDCYDHTVQLLDLVETYRELCHDLRDYYMAMVSNRLNETMKVLTIIATLFIPLSFVAGVYGMNFDPDASPWNMPELRWFWGYPFAMGLMASMAAGMLYFFRRRGWLGGNGHEPAAPIAKD